MSIEIKRAIDHHNTVAATIALKEATDNFSILKLRWQMALNRF